MANPLEAIFNMLRVALDNTNEPKSPLHVLEVGDIWSYLTLVEEFLRYEEIGFNTTTDDEVIEMLNDVVKICESQVKKISAFMRKEGIPLPDTASAKPHTSPNEVPLGVKLTDDEITNGVAFKLVTCSTACAKGQSDSVRNDVGNMWTEFFLEWTVFGGTLKTLMKKRGWLKVPPYYYAPGTPNK
ncbi:hypothetical protein KIS4809_3003 [Bacillus sp. ZZV12-4809]|nr:hypothetical protein KIS4809_3003 [Bacillus sp. ZZV12-4809]